MRKSQSPQNLPCVGLYCKLHRKETFGLDGFGKEMGINRGDSAVLPNIGSALASTSRLYTSN